MSSVSYQISLSYNQIRELVNQLSFKDKARLGKELAKQTRDKELSRLLESFRTNEIEQKDIDEEVEIVRAEIYAKTKKD
jgi:hypothetical protein